MSTKTLDVVDTKAITPHTNGSGKPRRILKRAEILAAKTVTYEDVPTDEWGEGSAVRVVAMDFDTRDLWELAQVAFADDKTGECFRGVRAKIVARCVVDDEGIRQFSDADVAAFEKKDAAPIKRCWEAVQRLSKLDKVEEEIEGAAKN